MTAGSWLYEKHPEWLLKAVNLPRICPIRSVATIEPGQSGGMELAGQSHRPHLGASRESTSIGRTSTWTRCRSGEWTTPQIARGSRKSSMSRAIWPTGMSCDGVIPNMLIDSCASGGRRNDLETLRRAVPFIRSDYLFEPIGQQGHMYGISSWMPCTGTGTDDRKSMLSSKIFKADWVPKGEAMESDSYLFRSVMTLHLTPCYDMRNKNLNYAACGGCGTSGERWRPITMAIITH